MLRDARHISIGIARPPDEVAAFAGDPRNLPRWASGLGSSVVDAGDGSWIADGALGRVVVRFVIDNPFGVLDHDVTLPSGVTVRNPLRVLPNGTGSELVFTLFGPPGGQLDDDAAWVRRDLMTLKALLEGAT